MILVQGVVTLGSVVLRKSTEMKGLYEPHPKVNDSVTKFYEPVAIVLVITLLSLFSHTSMQSLQRSISELCTLQWRVCVGMCRSASIR